MIRFLALFFCVILVAACSKKETFEVVAYFPEWGVEHQPYFVKDIINREAADKITVINYAFAVPTPDSLGRIYPEFMNRNYAYADLYSAEKSVDGLADDSNQVLRGHFNQLKKLKKKYPNIRLVISLGGWLGSVHFSDAAKTEKSREYFVDQCIDIFIKGNLPKVGTAGGLGAAAGLFDGIDIDWEYPISGGVEGIVHNENDTQNLTELFKLFRKKLDEINPKLLLTAALPAPPENLKNFNVTEDQKYLDWYLLMTYDFVGAWHGFAGHHSNLLGDRSKEKCRLSYDATVQTFLNKYKVDPKKIIPGVGFYGRSLKLENPDSEILYSSGKAAKGKYEAGFDYFEHIENKVYDDFVYRWDNNTMAPYLYSEYDSVFYTFDDEQSVILKKQYSKAYGLKGIMFWEVSADSKDGKLIKALDSEKMSLLKESENVKIPNNDIIIYPTDGEEIKAGENLRIIINENVEASFVEFYIDDKLIGTDSRKPISWVWFNAEKGEKEIRVTIHSNKNKKSFNKNIKIK